MRTLKLFIALFVFGAASAHAEIAALKEFSPSTVQSGETSTVTITLFNTSTSPSTAVSLTDSVPAGITVVPGSAATSCAPGTVDINGNDVALLGGEIPQETPQGEPGTCTITFEVTTNTAGQYTNTIEAGDLSGTTKGVPETNQDPASATLTVQPLANILGVKTAIPAIVPTGGTSRITLRLTNNNTIDITNASFTDNFPTSTPPNTYTLANPPDVLFTNCGPGDVAGTANPGDTSISFEDLTIPANDFCEISFDIVATGDWIARNDIPAGSITFPDQDVINNRFLRDLRVEDDIPTSKGWGNNLAVQGNVRRLFITLTNVFEEDINNVNFMDILPDNMPPVATPALEVANPSNAIWECDANFNNDWNDDPPVTQPATISGPGATTVEVTGATIPATTLPNVLRCRLAIDIQVNDTTVTGSQSYTNVINGADVEGTISTGPVTGEDATAPPLRVLDGGGTGIDVEKRFLGGLTTVPPGDPVTVPLLALPSAILRIDIVNSADEPALDFNFVDDFSGIGIEMNGNINVGGDCGDSTNILLGTVTDRQRLEFGTGYDPVADLREIPANSSCTVSVSVRGIQSSLGNTPPAPFNVPDTWLNDIDETADPLDVQPNWEYAVADPGVTQVDGDTQSMSDLIRVLPALSVTKLFSGDVIVAGGTSRLTITVRNPNTFVVENLTLDDQLSDSVAGDTVVANPPNLQTDNCGPVTVEGAGGGALAGAATIEVRNGVIPAAADINNPQDCIISLDVTSSTPDTERNTINVGDVVGDVQGGGGSTVENSNLTRDDLFKFLALPLQVNKQFNPQNPPASQATTRLIITLTNPDTRADQTGVSVIDNLPAGMTVANPQNFSTTCAPSDGNPAVINSSVEGGTDVEVSGINLPRNSSCQIEVDVTVSAAGVYTNTIEVGQVNSDEGGGNTETASASAGFFPNPAVEKAFVPDTIQAGAISELTIQVINLSSQPLTIDELVDNLPTEVVVAAPTTVSNNTCGGTVTAPAGGSTVTLNGPAALPAESSCSFTVEVTSDQPGTWTNEIPAGALITTQGETNVEPALADLTVLGAGSIQITKEVIDGPASAPWEFTVSTATAGCDIDGQTSFTVTTPADGGTATVTPLPSTSSDNGTTPCAYTVTETTQPGFNVTALSCDNGTADQANAQVTGIQVADGETVDCTFENTGTQGSIAVTKVVQGDDTNAQPWEFTLSTDTPGCDIAGVTPNPATTPAAGGTVTFADVPNVSSTDGAQCQYSVTETEQSGWAVQDDNPQTGITVVAGSTTAVTFTNVEQGQVSISKVVTGATEGYVAGSEFGIELACDDAAFDQSLLLIDGATAGPFDVDAGQNCTVTEPTLPAPATGPSYVAWAWDDAIIEPADFAVTGGTPTDVTVTNPLSRSEIAVVDPVTVGCSMETAVATFTITVFNRGTDALNDLQLTNDLATTFNAAAGFSIDSVAASGATANPAFDGDSDTNLLVGTDSLAPGASAEIVVTVSTLVTPVLAGTVFSNQVTASATGDATGLVVSDLSDITFSADPDPSLDNPTTFIFPCAPLPVPVMNTWAILLLMLSMLGIGLVARRRMLAVAQN